MPCFYLLLLQELFFFQPASAGHKNFCVSAYQLAEQVEACPQNEKFSAAATECLEVFHKEATSISVSLKKKFQNEKKKSRSAQNVRLENNGRNMNSTDRGLQYLLRIARRIREDLKLYITTIILPGNPGWGLLASVNIYDILAEQDCYKENRLLLERSLYEIDSEIKNLEKTDGKANAISHYTYRLQSSLGDLGKTKRSLAHENEKETKHIKGYNKGNSRITKAVAKKHPSKPK